tara:strand:- start:586 stop:903 length:318 start_codon:yes stop_codon:yes gene_type:complete
MTEDFKLIDNPEVPPALKPMTELHDKLVRGYNNDRELKLPRLIQSMEKRIMNQVTELVELEGIIQDSHHKLSSTLKLLKDILADDDIPEHVQEHIINTMDTIHGS